MGAEQLRAHLPDVGVNGSEGGRNPPLSVVGAPPLELQGLWEVQRMEHEVRGPVLVQLGRLERL